MMEDEELSYSDKSKLPYSLLLDPETNQAAAYTNNHRLITPLASAELVAFAKANASHQAAWDGAMHDATGQWRPLPEWATVDVLRRCVLDWPSGVWIRRGHESSDYWLSIPKK
jgi:hypothetical protein